MSALQNALSGWLLEGIALLQLLVQHGVAAEPAKPFQPGGCTPQSMPGGHDAALDIAFAGVSASLAMTLTFLVGCLALVTWMFKTGYRLKN